MDKSALFSFTPSLMDGETLEAIFVQREALAADLVERIRESVLTQNKLHTLIIGARGMGKTHLVSLVHHRVQAMDDLKERLLIAWLREEEWGVTSFLDLLLRIFRALAEGDTTLEERMEGLYDLSSEEAEAAGVRLLNELIGERTLLLIAENLDDLFGGLGEQGQQKLRAFLQTHANCTILATSPRLFNGVQRRTAPFYGFFRPVHLDELTTEEAQQLLVNIAKWRHQTDLVNFLNTPTGQTRVKAVQHLAGGNPRIYIIFADFLTHQSIEKLVSPFMSLVDALTPYYQSRMQYLSAQQRKIVELLCEKKSPIPVKTIAQRCFMTAQTASSQLKELREKGYVRAEAIGRDAFYEITEPLMRICLGVKKERGEPLRLMVDFLRVWYPRTELQTMQQKLLMVPERSRVMCRYVELALDDSKIVDQDPRIQAYLDEIKSCFEQTDYGGACNLVQKLCQIRDSWTERSIYAECLFKLGQYEDALKEVDRVIELNPSSYNAWNNRGTTLSILGRYEEALASYDKALDINPLFETWLNRGILLGNLNRYENEIISYDKALELRPDNSEVWNNRGVALGRLGHYEEAITNFDKTLELKPDNYDLWRNRGIVLGRLGRYEEAIASYDKALEINPEIEYCIKDLRSSALAALNNWAKNYNTLETLLDEEKPIDSGFLEKAIQSLFTTIPDPQQWQTNIVQLVNRLEERSLFPELGAALVKTASDLTSEFVSQAKATAWRDAWAEVVGHKPEFELPLRLLNTALHYKQTPEDPRVFLELPTEERKILQQALGIDHGVT
jgi:tetratricopeptide (TPR) repeat protein/DNA-binding transcriptional ArsR family regulator